MIDKLQLDSTDQNINLSSIYPCGISTNVGILGKSHIIYECIHVSLLSAYYYQHIQMLSFSFVFEMLWNNRVISITIALIVYEI